MEQGTVDKEKRASKELEDLYLQYFTPPAKESPEPGVTMLFEQVSVFDYSYRSYTSDSTCTR